MQVQSGYSNNGRLCRYSLGIVTMVDCAGTHSSLGIVTMVDCAGTHSSLGIVTMVDCAGTVWV